MPTDAKRICQFASSCAKYCPHRWAHLPKTDLGCNDDGCHKLEIRTPGLGHRPKGFIDEFGEDLTHVRRRIVRGFCVDYDYWRENTGHGQLIVTKGTEWEGFAKKEKKRIKALAVQRDADRAQYCAEMAKRKEEDAEASVPGAPRPANTWLQPNAETAMSEEHDEEVDSNDI